MFHFTAGWLLNTAIQNTYAHLWFQNFSTTSHELLMFLALDDKNTRLMNNEELLNPFFKLHLFPCQ